MYISKEHMLPDPHGEQIISYILRQMQQQIMKEIVIMKIRPEEEKRLNNTENKQ
jgi:hypothetical protein